MINLSHVSRTIWIYPRSDIALIFQAIMKQKLIILVMTNAKLLKGLKKTRNQPKPAHIFLETSCETSRNRKQNCIIAFYFLINFN